jgi:hypothetical protein
MTAIHAHRIAPFLGEWQLHETFDVMHPAPILLREESQSVTTSRLVPSEFGQSGTRLLKPSVDLRAAPMVRIPSDGDQRSEVMAITIPN